MTESYRMIVWGPGGLGGVAIWEIARLPEFELVGVRAFNPDKVGRDAGELIGIAPLGVVATDDVDALLAIECDCVLYTPRDFGNDNADEELLRILAAGHNVVTPLPYQNAFLYRDEAFVQRLNAACEQGGSTFHATGIDPDVISDRVVLGLTGLCTDVKHIVLREMWDVDHAPAELLGLVGFGTSPEEAEKNPIPAAISSNLLHAIGRTAEHTLGVTYDRVEEAHDYIAAPEDIALRDFHIAAGTVGRATHSFRGWVDSIGEEPFFTIEYNWVGGPKMLPEGVKPKEYWVAEIEGTPSVRMAIDLRTSLTGDDRYYGFGDLNSEPGYHGTVAPCLQAIPHVCTSPPGVLPSFGPGLHWKRDLRTAVAVEAARS